MVVCCDEAEGPRNKVKYRILLLADHAQRDTPGLASLRVQLERTLPEAVDVRICDIHLFSAMVELFHPHIVCVNHLHDTDRNRIVDKIQRRGGLCVVLPSEGRPNSDSQLEWTTQAWSPELCDLYCSWSETVASVLYPTVRRAVTGGLRFDMYFPPLNALIKSKEEVCSIYGLDPKRPIITIASSFPNAKFSEANTEFLVSDWKKLKVDTVKGREDPVAFVKEDKKRFDQFQAWLLILSRERPEYQLLVKPHPAESVADWNAFCDGIGAKLMLSDFIFNLFAVSDVHVARADCLTLPEAWIAGKRTVGTMLGEELTGAGLDATQGYTALARNSEAFIRAIDCDLKSGFEPELRDTYIQKWLGPMPGSAKRVAEAIGSLLEERKPVAWKEPGMIEYATLHKLLEEHSRNNAVPKADWLGQYAKTVTLEHSDWWVRAIRALS